MVTPSMSLSVSSLRVGRPRLFEESGSTRAEARPWTSALIKEPVTGPTWLSSTNLAGDEQADQRNHGGAEQALCVYPSAHYPYWSKRLGHPLKAGSFGENLTLTEPWVETDVCIGDIFAFGQAVIQISQPRSPCYKVARRWQAPHLALWMQESGFTGWYMRVLQPGLVTATDLLLLLERAHPEWSVARANATKYGLRHDRSLTVALASCPALGEQWRRKMQGRSNGTMPLYDDATRIYGAVEATGAAPTGYTLSRQTGSSEGNNGVSNEHKS